MGAAIAAPLTLLGVTASVSQTVVYGADDRIEWRSLPESPLKRRTRGAVAALVPWSHVLLSGDGVVFSAAPLGLKQGLCPTQPFTDQPAAAHCTGVLIDDALLVTASHCVESLAECRETAFVFEFLESAPGEIAANADTVYGCRTLTQSESQNAEWSLVVLDRPTRGDRVPLDWSPGALGVGAPVVLASHGQGIPLKIDPKGRVHSVAQASSAWFEVAVDAFGGSSGAPVMNPEGILHGILQRGRWDYLPEEACQEARTVDAGAGAEHVTPIASIVSEICDSGWPSTALCDRPSSCGDGVCSGAETHASCVADCPAAECGDSLCEVEERDGCGEDCGSRRPSGLPFAWYCPFDWYAGGDGCDCDCGAPDPDCLHDACDAFGPRRSSQGGVHRIPVRVRGGCAISADRTGGWHAIGGGWLALLLARARRRAHARDIRSRPVRSR